MFSARVSPVFAPSCHQRDNTRLSPEGAQGKPFRRMFTTGDFQEKVHYRGLPGKGALQGTLRKKCTTGQLQEKVHYRGLSGVGILQGLTGKGALHEYFKKGALQGSLRRRHNMVYLMKR